VSAAKFRSSGENRGRKSRAKIADENRGRKLPVRGEKNTRESAHAGFEGAQGWGGWLRGEGGGCLARSRGVIAAALDFRSFPEFSPQTGDFRRFLQFSSQIEVNFAASPVFRCFAQLRRALFGLRVVLPSWSLHMRLRMMCCGS
jgi:hypothetical protein